MAEKLSSRIETQRTIQEVNDELHILNMHLSSLADISEDTEQMYEKYMAVYNELKQKAELVAENKQRVLAEVEIRKQTWRKVIREFLDKLGETYRDALTAINATGDIKLIDFEDVDTAGLEIDVGFHGFPPTTLDAYIQSGGERTTSVMAFLLSLQKHVKSPIRAVDEFDVHMDLRNREVISKLILSTVKAQKNIQYLVITPSQLPLYDEDTNIILVQNVEGRSEVKVAV